MTFRAAVIGCGKIGSGFADDPLLAGDVYTHSEAYVCSPTTELVAVCDRDVDVAQRCGERWNVGSFTSAEEMLAGAEPEIVSICTPDQTHYEIARRALECPSVRAILCEKPLAADVAEGEELVRLAGGSGKIIAVAYVRRYAENMRAVHRFVDEGSLGPIRAISGWYGKGVLHNGSHWFDLLRMLTGEVEWVEAADRLREGGDPSLDVTLGLQSGAVATLRAADTRNFTIFEMELLTEGGRISIRDGGHTISLCRARPSARYSGYTELAPEAHDFGDQRNLMLHAVEDLADALANKRPPLCTGEDGLAALRVATAARKSAAENGRRIGVSA